MKKARYGILLIVNLFLLLGCSSCVFEDKTPDNQVFTSFEPLEWSDNYIFAATNYPPSIQVWDKESCKLIKNYSLVKNYKNNYRELFIWDMEVLGHCVWFTASGYQKNTIRFDIETGRLNYIQLDCKPEFIEICKERNSVFVSTFSAKHVGVAIRELDIQGNILNKYDIKHDDIKLSEVAGARYVNGNYYLTASKDNDYSKEKQDEIGYRVLCLKDSNYLIKELCKDTLIKYIEISLDKYISSFRMIQSYSNTAPIFAELNIVHGSECSRYLYRINSFEPFDAEYTGIKYDGESARAMFSVTEKDESIYWTGRLLHGDITGLECARYSSQGGEELSSVKMPEANQLYCARFEDCTWFSRDVYTQDDETLEWDKTGSPKIYKVDFTTNKVLLYNSDGTYEVVGTL